MRSWGIFWRGVYRRAHAAKTPPRRRWGALVPVGVGLLVGWAVIAMLEARLQPVVALEGEAQAQNAVVAALDTAVTRELARQGVGYSDLVEIQRGEDGSITALTTNITAMNSLRTALVDCALQTLEELDVSQIQVPLGSVINSELLWGRGPVFQARGLTVGTVQGEFVSDFSQAGINQTRHRIYLEVEVPLTLVLAGGRVETVVETSIPVAETVIVGQVPQTYLQWGG